MAETIISDAIDIDIGIDESDESDKSNDIIGMVLIIIIIIIWLFNK